MARTTFSGPVKSDNGFEGDISATVITASSATVTNLIATTLTIGTMKITQGSAVSGSVSAQLGYIPVMVGATTAYIALYQSVTV